jgi:hypothetical protein
VRPTFYLAVTGRWLIETSFSLVDDRRLGDSFEDLPVEEDQIRKLKKHVRDGMLQTVK